MEEYILPERKAFNAWFNQEFYKRLVQSRSGKDHLKKVYQELLREYINTDTPFRGALVFHGLGTGKTATAITAVEGAGSDWEIITILPASLESNFKEEIKRFGDMMFRIYKNDKTKWKLIKWDKLDEETQQLYAENYSIDSRYLKNLHKKVFEHKDSKKSAFIFIEDKGGTLYDKLPSEKKKLYLNEQITRMIEAKYHFMGYSPFRDFTKIDGKYKGIIPSDKLYHSLVRDAASFGTPFNKKVIIIDEVHGFISNIVNKLSSKEEQKGAMMVYNWIMAAESCKLVCLSATPIVNRPNEMAVLINMLKGNQKVYTFDMPLLSEEEFLDFSINIKAFFSNSSPVKQFLLQKTRDGTILLSIVKNIPNFVSVIGYGGVVKTVQGDNSDPEEKFIFNIYDKLQEIYSAAILGKPKDLDLSSSSSSSSKSSKSKSKSKSSRKKKKVGQINPTKEQIHELLKPAMKKAQSDFYKEISAFTIINNEGELIDCTNNDNFLDTFVDPDYNIRPDRRNLLLRMCAGCVSYYPSSDKQASEDMATKNKVLGPEYRLEGYERYKILEFINVVVCPMTYTQFDKYDEERQKEKDKVKMSRNGKVIYNYESNKAESKQDNSYHIRSRILGTIVNDEDHNINNILQTPELLREYSPKFYNLMNNITSRKHKCLVYSTFIQNGGLNNIEVMLTAASIEFRRVTGDESKADKQRNIDEFNRNQDIMVMLISEAGAQGISLENVRDVHIIEPHWNFTRMEQVIGRAIRKGSHASLPKSQRNVSIFMYISTIPDEKTADFLNAESISLEERKKLSVRITKLKMADNHQTMDQYLLSIMETKYKITEQCKDILIEASIDCKQHAGKIKGITCLEFPSEMATEDLYFPGISSGKLGLMNPKQVKVRGVQKGNYFTMASTNDTKSEDYLLFYNVGNKKNIKTSDLGDPDAVLAYSSGRVLLEDNDCLNEPPPGLKCLGNVIALPAEELQESDKLNYTDLLKYNEKDFIVGYKVFCYSNKKEYFATADLSNELSGRKKINRMYYWPEFEDAGFNENSPGVKSYLYKNKKVIKV